MKSYFFLISPLLLSLSTTQQVYCQAKAVPTGAKTTTAATRPEILTNKGVVALSTAGFSSNIITSKISSSTCTFDLSTNGLLALKQAGVKDEVIASMMSRSNEKFGSAAATPSNKTSKAIPKLEMANHPYARNMATNSWLPLENTSASMKSKMIAMGYGGTKFLYQVSAEKSTTRLTATDSVFFLINTFSAGIPELVLYHAKIENGKRTVVGSQIKMTGVSAGQDNLLFNVLPLGEGIFRLVPTQNLTPGEYFFSTKPVLNSVTVDVYAFGID